MAELRGLPTPVISKLVVVMRYVPNKLCESQYIIQTEQSSSGQSEGCIEVSVPTPYPAGPQPDSLPRSPHGLIGLNQKPGR